MIKVGLFINPVAGCGQLFNMKGSDTLTPSMCPRSISFEKAVEFLNEVRDADVFYYTASGIMGEEAFRKAGVGRFDIIHEYSEECSSSDTRSFVEKLSKTGAGLLVFFGGDGTARDIIDAGCSLPVIGVPLGTKMFSSVFAISVPRAIQVFLELIKGKSLNFAEADVIDLNEASYLKGEMALTSYGTLKIPVSDFIMSESKAEYPETSVEAIAEYVIEHMEEGVNYLVGPGSTCKAINSMLGVNGSLLGFDLLRDRKLVKEDLSEKEIYDLTSGRTMIILSPIGGQGFLIGRGNKQLSGRIISKIGFQNLIVVSSEEKLRGLNRLYVDVNNLTIPRPSFIRILFSYGRFKLMPVLY